MYGRLRNRLRSKAPLTDWQRDFNRRRDIPPSAYCDRLKMEGTYSERVAVWLRATAL